MSAKKASVPRAHHFVPRCWLAGFTETGQKTGRLWVTDLRKRKQWPSNPQNTGHRRDFYRTADAQGDPVAAEKFFSKIEGAVAPVLKRLYEKPRARLEDELEDLLFFAAFQYVRVPAFRPVVLKIADSLHRRWVAEALKSRTSWTKALKKAGIPVDSAGASYEDMLKFERNTIRTGEYSLSAENDWYLMRGFSAAQRSIIPSLRARHWGACVSPSGSYIGSDNPVVMDGPPGQQIGFQSAEIIVFPVNRHVSLFGIVMPLRPAPVTRNRIARHNTFTMLTADQYVYSHAPDFCWLDEHNSYQTNWKLFSKENFL
jgi:Protein of unknown function (DUF4238)